MNRTASYRIVRAWLARQAANVDLSWEDSLSTLGFHAGMSPSKAEVQSAWRALARKHHPDLGGDVDKMVELNAAKDILDGVRAPSRGRVPTQEDYDTSPHATSRETVTFAEAFRNVSIPSGVNWIFITEELRAVNNYEGSEGSHNSSGYVALGQTSTQMVVLLVKSSKEFQTYSIYESRESFVWSCILQTGALKKGKLDVAAATKAIKALMVQAEITKPGNPSVHELDADWTPSEQTKHRGRGENMSEFFVVRGLKKGPTPTSDGSLQVDLAVPAAYNQGQKELYIFIGEKSWKLDWETVPNKNLYWTMASAIVTRSNPSRGFIRKNIDKIKNKAYICKIMINLIEKNYFETKPPMEVLDLLKAALVS